MDLQRPEPTRHRGLGHRKTWDRGPGVLGLGSDPECRELNEVVTGTNQGWDHRRGVRGEDGNLSFWSDLERGLSDKVGERLGSGEGRERSGPGGTEVCRPVVPGVHGVYTVLVSSLSVAAREDGLFKAHGESRLTLRRGRPIGPPRLTVP